MANHLTKYNVGIDAVINSVQEEVYPLLVERWNDKLNGYGRVYKNRNSDDKLIPERHVKKKEYEDVLFDDNFSGTFFFVDDDTHRSTDGQLFNTEVKCIFMVNLKEILGDEFGRPDEIAHRDAREIFMSVSDDRYTIVKIEKGVDAAFFGLDKSKVENLDLNPLHVFSVVMDLDYYLMDKCE